MMSLMPTELGAGMLVGRYRLVRLIAEGGMGAVWEGRDDRLERAVAVKVLPEMLVRDDEARRRFEREARALARLEHPNVVAIYDFGSADPGTGETRPYLVMQLVAGVSLDREIASGPLGMGRAVGLVEQVARALAAAHEAGVIHRDLKPSNIMVGAGDHVWVLDFGLARLARGAGRVVEETLTTPGMVLGSCPYMAPEQALGQEVVPASDQFSCGAVLYEAVSGRRAFVADTPMRVLQAVVHCDYPPLEEVRPDVPPDLAAVVDRCLSREPGRRYPSAADLARDLAEVRRGLAAGDPALTPTVRVSSGSVGALRERRRRARRRAIVVGAAAAAAGLLLGLAVGRVGTEKVRPDPGRWTVRELLDLPGSLRHPGWHPTGTELAVDHLRGDRGELLVVPADGGAPRVLARAEAGSRFAWPRYSPDGRALAVATVAEGRQSVLVIPAVGGPPLAQIDGAQHAAWRDDRTVLLSRFVEGAAGLWEHDLETGAERLALAPRETIWWFGAERSTGGRLALLGGATAGRVGVWVLDRPGGEPQPWLEPGPPLLGVSWAPGGRSLLASVDGALTRLDEDGTDRLVPRIERLWDPSFAPDGTRLAAVRQETMNELVAFDPAEGSWSCVLCGVPGAGWGSLGPDGTVVYRRLAAGRLQLYLRRPDGDERPLTPPGEEGSCPVFSPDGEAVAYLAPGDEGETDLRVVAVNGGDPVTVASAVEGSEYPSWSPDGRHLAYAGGAPVNVWVVSRAGGEPRQLTRSGGDYPRWSPDGRRIAYVIWTEESDPLQGAWVVDAAGGEPVRVGDLPTQLGWSPDGSRLWQLRRPGAELELWYAEADGWQWRRSGTVRLGAPAAPHLEHLPFTIDRRSGHLVFNRRSSTGALVVFDGVDPRRW